MEVYGETGYAIAVNNTLLMRIRNKETEPRKINQGYGKRNGVYEDPISYFADVVRE